MVSSGLMNKQIAAELGLAEITVKIHRGHIMKKMGAKSLLDLVMKAETLGIRHNKLASRRAHIDLHRVPTNSWSSQNKYDIQINFTDRAVCRP